MINAYLKWLTVFLVAGTALNYYSTGSVSSQVLSAWDYYAFMWALRFTYLWGRSDAKAGV